MRSAQSPAVSGHTPRRRRESQGRDPSVRQNSGETGAWSGDIRGIYIDQEGLVLIDDWNGRVVRT